MTTPDIFETVGFNKTKVGSGDKELGYAIKKSRLSGLICGSAVIVIALGLIVVLMLFEVHFEKRSFHRQLRKEEHHAASKLAQVEMELWAQYRDDIQESREANSLLRNLNASYQSFQKDLQVVIDTTAKEVNMNPAKASHLADKILRLFARVQEENIKHAKPLMDHLMASGKRGTDLEKHVGKEILKEVTEEEKQIEEDEKEGNHMAFAVPEGANASGEVDTLKATLEGFWWTFHDYEGEFKEKTRPKMMQSSPALEQLKVLSANITSDSPPSEMEISAALDRIDLGTLGIGLGSGRMLPPADIVEELLLIPKIPHEELAALEKAWRKGEKDSLTVFGQLVEWHAEQRVPSGWLQLGVDKEEREEQQEEHREEALEERGAGAKEAAHAAVG